MAVLEKSRFEELRAERSEELRRRRAEGQKVVGYFCLYAPVELVRAAGAIPIRLARADDQSSVLGERFLRVDACPFVKASLGKFRTDPVYQQVDAVVSVNTCDMMRRLPEAISANFNIPVFSLYLPRTSEPFPDRLAVFQAGMVDLKDRLLKLTGRKWQDERLVSEMAVANRLRSRLQELDRTRVAENPGLRASELFEIIALASFLSPETMEKLLNEIQPISSSAFGQRRARLLLTGSIVAEADRMLIEIVEEKADIVADTICTGSRWFWGEISEKGEPFAELARFYFTRSPCACRRPNTALFDHIRRLVRERRVQGIINKSLLYCDAYRFEVQRLREDVGLPVLDVDGDYSVENRQQLRTRIEAFLEMLR